jgi:hypothetical protein
MLNFQTYKHCHPHQTRANTRVLTTVEGAQDQTTRSGLHGLAP